MRDNSIVQHSSTLSKNNCGNKTATKALQQTEFQIPEKSTVTKYLHITALLLGKADFHKIQ